MSSHHEFERHRDLLGRETVTRSCHLCGADIVLSLKWADERGPFRCDDCRERCRA